MFWHCLLLCPYLPNIALGKKGVELLSLWIDGLLETVGTWMGLLSSDNKRIAPSWRRSGFPASLELAGIEHKQSLGSRAKKPSAKQPWEGKNVWGASFCQRVLYNERVPVNWSCRRKDSIWCDATLCGSERRSSWEDLERGWQRVAKNQTRGSTDGIFCCII